MSKIFYGENLRLIEQLFGKAQVYFFANDQIKSMALYKMIISLLHEYESHVLNNIAVIHANNKEYDDAIQSIEKSISIYKIGTNEYYEKSLEELKELQKRKEKDGKCI